MGFFDRLLGRKSTADSDAGGPFMEHPTGQFPSATDAMADAIKRLRALPAWNDWITFSAQGMGHDADSDQVAEIRMRRDEIQLDKKLDIESIVRFAGAARSSLLPSGENYSLASASPAEAARVMDAIYRQALGIRPHPEEENDYAVGAEW
jgi:hypothetical protein